MGETLSAWLRTHIQLFNTNPYGITRAIGVTPRTVYKWLDGTHIPSPDNCRKLASFFGAAEHDVLILAGHLSANPGPTQDRPSPYSIDGDPQLGYALSLFSQLGQPDRQRILAIMKAFGELPHESPRRP